MFSISNVPSPNGGGRTPQKGGVCLFSLLSNSFPWFHLNMAGLGKPGWFPCPAGQVVDWYWEWADLFHCKWQTTSSKFEISAVENIVRKESHPDDILQVLSNLVQSCGCFLSVSSWACYGLWAWIESASHSPGKGQGTWLLQGMQIFLLILYIVMSISSPFPCFYDHITIN